jgi:hypothetical protein
VGTTKSTIDSVRENSHWNAANLTAMDPVTLGLCSQIELDLEVKRASKDAGIPNEVSEGTTLLTAEEALARANARQSEYGSDSEDGGEGRRSQAHEDLDADSVFSKLKSLKTDADE